MTIRWIKNHFFNLGFCLTSDCLDIYLTMWTLSIYKSREL